jgi:hypothetical protein
MPVPGGVPAGVMDVGIEVRAHPDAYSPEAGAGASAQLVLGGGVLPWPQVVRPTGPGTTLGDLPPAGARLWVDEATPERRVLASCSVVPLLARGSVVIATGLEPDEAVRIRAAEAVSAGPG